MRNGRCPDMTNPKLDRETARALVDAGYMPMAEYVRLFGPNRSDRSPTDANGGREAGDRGRERPGAGNKDAFVDVRPARGGYRLKSQYVDWR